MLRAHEELMAIMARLEMHYKYPQDVEFTVQQGKLFMLQTRNAKRTGLAGVRWAVEMATGEDIYTGAKQSQILTQKEALMTLSGGDLEQLLFPIFDTESEKVALELTTGLPAGPGAAMGQIVFSAKAAELAISKSKHAKVILVRHETSPEDVGGMWAAQGVLTSTGGMTSHAAVVARGWGKCCICGASTIEINYGAKTLKVGDEILNEGDWISLNGSIGKVYKGKIPLMPSPVESAIVENNPEAKEHPIYKMYALISKWSDENRKINVRTNADSPKMRQMLAHLVRRNRIMSHRTYVFEGDRIWAIREFILSEDETSRKFALQKLLKLQQNDFEGIFQAMNGLPVTIRLLDPPLHEFVPHSRREELEMAQRLGVSERKLPRVLNSFTNLIRCSDIVVAVYQSHIQNFAKCKQKR